MTSSPFRPPPVDSFPAYVISLGERRQLRLALTQGNTPVPVYQFLVVEDDGRYQASAFILKHQLAPLLAAYRELADRVAQDGPPTNPDAAIRHQPRSEPVVTGTARQDLRRAMGPDAEEDSAS